MLSLRTAAEPVTTQPPSVIISASEEESRLEEQLSSLTGILNKIAVVAVKLEQIKAGSLVSEAEQTTSVFFISIMVEIVMKMTDYDIADDSFTQLMVQLDTFTNVQTLDETQTDIITSLLLIVTRLEITSTLSISGASQSLIRNKGLIVAEISTTELSFEDQASEADKQLGVFRDNCKGMSDVAKELGNMTPDYVCEDIYDDDCEIAFDVSQALH